MALIADIANNIRVGLPKLGDVRHHFEIRVLVPRCVDESMEKDFEHFCFHSICSCSSLFFIVLPHFKSYLFNMLMAFNIDPRLVLVLLTLLLQLPQFFLPSSSATQFMAVLIAKLGFLMSLGHLRLLLSNATTAIASPT